MILPPLTLKKNDSCAQFFSMGLAAVTEASSSHVTKKCMTSSSASLDEPSPINAYAANPSSTRAAADQMKRYVRGGTDWRK